MASDIVLSTQDYKVVGQRPVRHDGADKVTGRAQYGADINLPDLLHAKILRSPHSHARIVSIDTSEAEALPGVQAVITAADFPKLSGKGSDQLDGTIENLKFLSNNCIADTKVLYVGHAVAAVAATSSHLADEALGLIRVEYQVLEPVLDVLDAMKDDAPILHEGLENVANSRLRGGSLRAEGEPGKDTNIAATHIFELGDTEKGSKEADVVVEREFRTRQSTPGIHRAPLRDGPMGSGWEDHGLVQQPRTLQREGPDIPSPGHSGLPDQSGPHGDRGWLWGQGDHIPGALGRDALQEVWAHREAYHEPHGGARSHWAHLRRLHEGEDGREEGRRHHWGGGSSRLRGRRFPRLARCSRLYLHVLPLQPGERKG